MMTITVTAFFTKNTGQPATGLTLAEINLYLTAQNKATLVQTVIWSGAQHPTAEADNVGGYSRNYAGEDLDTYDYLAAARYMGGETLDTDWITGSIGQGITSQETDDKLDSLVSTAAGLALEATAQAILADTGTDGVVVAAGSKTGYKLAADGLDSISITAPAGVASNFREMVVQLWRRFFKKATMTSTALKTWDDAGTVVVTTQALSDDTTTQTQGAAT